MNKVTASSPYIPDDQILPEITVRSVILSLILVVLLCAANIYLGLKVGITVSASIPAAVISMGILRFFKNSNILENNIVQTAASSGESLAGVIFILPALLILHAWTGFNYFQTIAITITGGILGVLFSVPIRHVLLNQKNLRFPEGTAIAEVLKTSSQSKMGIKYLLQGGFVGGLVSFLQSGFEAVSNSLDVWFRSNNVIYGFSLGFDPALIAAGYIIGFGVGSAMFIGYIIGWGVGVPLVAVTHAIPHSLSPTDAAFYIWQHYIRLIGVGTMLVGGLWTLITLTKPVIAGLRSSFQSLRTAENLSQLPRTERVIPFNYVLWGSAILCIPIGCLAYHFSGNAQLGLSPTFHLIFTLISVVFVFTACFIFSCICGYLAGLIGSTNNPISGLTLSVLLLASLLVLALLSPSVGFSGNPIKTLAGATLAIILTSIATSGIAIMSDTIQDLKAGQLVGATPWKQQAMLILGAVVAAAVIPLILQLLFNAYGIGGVFPRSGMDPQQMLAAPQAALMATLASGVFLHSIQWDLIGIGAGIAILFILINHTLQNRGMSLPVLAVGSGIYLPPSATIPVMFGGFASLIIQYFLNRNHAQSDDIASSTKSARQRGLILACGMVAGAALMGVILAIPFAIKQSSDALKIVSDHFTPIANLLAVIVTIGILYWYYRVVCKAKDE